MQPGSFITLWTIRAAGGLYVLAVAGWLTQRYKSARLAWTFGCLFYLAHVGAAFQFYHHWSHQAAYRETARQTAEMFGIWWGGGLYLNYLFTVVWAADVLWCWQNPDAYRSRPKWMTAALHSFLAFMFFNGTVVFASGWVRWVGVTAAAALGILATLEIRKAGRRGARDRQSADRHAVE